MLDGVLLDAKKARPSIVSDLSGIFLLKAAEENSNAIYGIVLLGKGWVHRWGRNGEDALVCVCLCVYFLLQKGSGT
jgi:hypothetical protein